MSERRGRGRPYACSLCFDCSKAGSGCRWSRNTKPVEGWTAEPTIVRGAGKNDYSSFHVRSCPEFDRDAFAGGTREKPGTSKPITICDLEATQFLAEAIIERTIEDWEALHRGALENVVVLSQRVYRADVLSFFFSKYFENLLHVFTDVTASQIRQKIGVTEEMRGW